MNWVPVKLDIKDKKDIEFVTRKKQIVLVDGTKDSLSILTLPYPVSGGARSTMSIDFFGECSQLLIRHIQEQLRHLRTPETMTIIQERHPGGDINDVFLTVFIGVKMRESFTKLAEEELGLGKFCDFHGSVKRNHYKMYIYEKNLR